VTVEVEKHVCIWCGTIRSALWFDSVAASLFV